MKTRYLSPKNFDRLWHKLKAKERFCLDENVRFPYETDEEYQDRMNRLKERPMSIKYHGRFHIIEFLSK